MPSNVEKLSTLECQLNVTVPAEEVSQAYKKRLDKIASTAKIDGFRPGKVPTHVIEQRFGKGVAAEVANDLLQESFETAIEEHKLRVAGMPNIDAPELDKSKEFAYSAKFEVYPEIELKQLDGQNVEQIDAQITDADLDKMIDNIRRQHATWEDVERESKDGDRLVFDFEGFMDDKPFDGGSAKDFELELGSKQMIPGFEEGLVGAKAGQELDLTVTFPEDYAVKDLAGKPAVFKIKVHKVQAAALPELDDAFAEKVGVKEKGVEGLKEEVRKNMQAELKRILTNKNKEFVLDKLVEVNEVEVPNSLIDIEVEHLQKMTLQQMAAQQGMKELPKIDMPKEPYIDQAKKRVILGLLLAEAIKLHDIKADADLVRSRVEEIAAAYSQSEEIVNWYYQNKQLMSEIEAAVLEEQVVAKLVEQAKVDQKSESYDDLVNETR